jgi:hypothetical protein
MGARDILQRLRGRATVPPVLPTADYYLLAGVADLVDEGTNATGSPERPIVRRGPHTWVCGDRLIIVRYATVDELAWIEGRRWRSVHYVVDDLLPAVETSFELPADYRERLGVFVRGLLPRILALSPIVVSPSLSILEVFPGLEQRRLDPACLSLCDGGMLPLPATRSSAPSVVFLGTRSHLGSLPLIAEIAERLDRSCPGARVHLFFGRNLPRALIRSRIVVNRAAMPWPAFRAFCRTARFDVALAPVQDTPFAQARSITKLMDHAAVGAVGIYGDRPPFRGVISHGVDGLLLSDEPQAWADAIQELAAAPLRATQIAAGGGALAARLGDPARVRRFWTRELGLDG